MTISVSKPKYEFCDLTHMDMEEQQELRIYNNLNSRKIKMKDTDISSTMIGDLQNGRDINTNQETSIQVAKPTDMQTITHNTSHETLSKNNVFSIYTFEKSKGNDNNININIGDSDPKLVDCTFELETVQADEKISDFAPNESNTQSVNNEFIDLTSVAESLSNSECLYTQPNNGNNNVDVISIHSENLENQLNFSIRSGESLETHHNKNYKEKNNLSANNTYGVQTSSNPLANTNSKTKTTSELLIEKLHTIDDFKKDIKTTKDPKKLFEYAQYILKTGIDMKINENNVDDGDGDNTNKSTLEKEDFLMLQNQFLKEGIHYLKKLSVKGYSDAQFLLGDIYSSGDLGKTNHKEAYILFQTAAKHGNINAAFRTAECFEKGLGTARDSRKAVEFLKFAASRQHPEAMLKLGLYSFHGEMGLPNDLNTKQNGIKWLTRVAVIADEKTCSAPYELAKIYEKGFLDIIIPDSKYALTLYIQASVLGHVKSNTKLGTIYETGEMNVQPNNLLSIHYYTLAATDENSPDPEAQLGLCAWYLVGSQNVLEKDEKEAFLWAMKSAELNYDKAQYAIGNFYERGIGCLMDFNQAYKWYEKAAKNKNLKAIEKINKMTSRDSNDFITTISSKSSRNLQKYSKNIFSSRNFSTDSFTSAKNTLSRKQTKIRNKPSKDILLSDTPNVNTTEENHECSVDINDQSLNKSKIKSTFTKKLSDETSNNKLTKSDPKRIKTSNKCLIM